MVRVFPPQFFFSSIFCGKQKFSVTAGEHLSSNKKTKLFYDYLEMRKTGNNLIYMFVQRTLCNIEQGTEVLLCSYRTVVPLFSATLCFPLTQQ